MLTGDTGIYLLVFFPGVETWPGNACFKENVSGNGFSYGNERKAGRQLSGRFGCLPDSGRLSFLCQLSVLHLGQVFPSPSAVVSLVCRILGPAARVLGCFFLLPLTQADSGFINKPHKSQLVFLLESLDIFI